ncbi:PhnA domain-containing protein [Roseibium salinum]|uniref:PhnA domain-containing protein n=1 Tax=Roseibium salinum TaxID=1604349 RepID=A0ABT3R4W4_9HYPH|nr:alkylphosphonate utilization protein [Roseibium sp. DSM 29163]MCX2724199.1 PhnA domain-containing protein [Roseibium sp. DSM 29163]
MSVEQDVRGRAGNACECCGSTQSLAVLDVGPAADGTADAKILACSVCADQITGAAEMDPNHWHCLNDAAWSQVPAVQVTAYRLLARMPDESWARELLDMLYLEDEVLAWAKAGVDNSETGEDASALHKDTHGAILKSGDTVTLIKDLKVKGASFTAKRGTAVRNISLVADNPAQIEGRVNDQRIVILTEFVKKS